jgi:hypothetical protein
VNEIMSMSGCAEMASPTTSPVPCTMLNTPGGRPASAVTSARISAVSGASSDGLSTTVLPATRAGASLATTCCSGKFHGVIAPTTPIGSCTTSELPISAVQSKSLARSAMEVATATGKSTCAVLDSPIGAPISAVIAAARSARRAARPAPIRRTISARSSGEVSDQVRNAARATPTARFTSAAVPAGITPAT